MRQLTGWQLPAFGWIVLAAAGAASLAGLRGSTQVRVGGELGWQGVAVVGEVNPLTITVENGTGSVLSATLRAEQRLGSGWRGQVLQRVRVPVLLAPGGRTQLLFPWPVEAGSDPVTVVLESGDATLAQATLPLRLAVEKPVAVVGARGGPSLGPALVLSPADLPEDPLLLSPFAEVQVGPTSLVSARARAALQAWAVFSGGVVTGLSTLPSVGVLRDADLRQALREHGPRPPPAGLLLGGTAIYLVALGYALSAVARRPQPPAALVLPVSLALALFYPLAVGTPQTHTIIHYRLFIDSVSRFSLDTLAIASRRGGVQELDGWWVERVVPGSKRVARVMTWRWTDTGPRTSFEVDPGETLFLYRYSLQEVRGGREVVVGPGGAITRAEPGFVPLLAAVEGRLREGDRLVLEATQERRGGVAWHGYLLRWKRDG